MTHSATPPAFCDGARKVLATQIADETPRVPNPRYYLRGDGIQAYFSAMQWLMQNGCNMDAEIADIDTNIHLYPESPDREELLLRLARLQARHISKP